MNEQSCFSEQASVQILTPTSLSDEWRNRHLFNEFQQYIKKGIQRYIIDLSQLPIINSVGINFLLRLLKKVQQMGGQLFLVNVSAQVLYVLDITKLTSVFTIIEGEEVGMPKAVLV